MSTEAVDPSSADSFARRAVHELARRDRAGREVTLGDALAATVALRDAIDEYLGELVPLAREEGATWAEIGAALGVSTQAAQQRFGRTR